MMARWCARVARNIIRKRILGRPLEVSESFIIFYFKAFQRYENLNVHHFLPLIVDMTFRRRNAGVVAHNGLLYVVGGDDGTSNLPNVEVSNSIQTHSRRTPYKM